MEGTAEKPNRIEILRNLLVLAALVAAVLFSWMVGHTLRYSIPALWHPPIRETNPQTRYGAEFDFDGIRRTAVLPGLAPKTAASVRIQVQARPGFVSNECMALTYFTSLPAKCLTADGRLVIARGADSNVFLIPQRK